jgi:hypothetical protein
MITRRLSGWRTEGQEQEGGEMEGKGKVYTWNKITACCMEYELWGAEKERKREIVKFWH